MTGPAAAFRDHSISYFEQLLQCETYSACNRCNGCRQLSNGTHPDTIAISPDGASIKIDQIRELIDRIKYGPSSHRWLTVTMPDAHTMTTQAANSLLKTLESPPDGVIFLLGAPNRGAVLPTIASRTQHIHCENLSTDQLNTYLTQSGIELDPNWALAPNATLGLAKSGIKLPGPIPSITTLLALPPGQRVILTHGFGKSKDLVQICLLTWIESLWGIVHEAPSSNSVPLATQRLDLLVENILKLRYNLNPRLHLDQILYSL
ncbi:hypothetical protein EBR57_08370 [bacterium]|nr:hypothetical protein [bacterium]